MIKTSECFHIHKNLFEPLREYQTEEVFLALTERQFSTVFAKAFCQYVYGKQLNKNTWQNWRKWVGITGKKRTCNYDQLCRLIGIARLRLSDRLDGRNYYPELTKKDIQLIKQEIDTIKFHQEMLRGIQFMDQHNFVMGADLPNYLGVSMRDLLKHVPGFNKTLLYIPEQVKSLLT